MWLNGPKERHTILQNGNFGRSGVLRWASDRKRKFGNNLSSIFLAHEQRSAEATLQFFDGMNWRLASGG